MSIANEISKLQQNLLDCYDACADNGAYLPEDINFDNLANCIEQISNPFNKPADWSDIRKDCPANSIALYAGHTTDFSQYNNLGFTATCTGGYNVFIDGTQYGTTYASGAQCNITWSTSGITTGDDIITPSTLKAHKIWIVPATEGNDITAFHCARVAASGTEEQGVLWAHFNLDNAINLGSAFGFYGNYKQTLMEALTAKNNIINCTGAESLFFGSSSLAYSPILDFQNAEISFYGLIWNSAVKTLKIKNAKPTSLQYFAYGSEIENLKMTNCDFSKTTTLSSAFNYAAKIKVLPDFNFSTPCLGGAEPFVFQCSALTNDVILDLSNCTALNKFIATNTSKFKGLRVSNQAPFSGSAPQINVSYTGMDRASLVQLFNDLPYNVGYTIVGNLDITDGIVSGFSESNYLSLSVLPNTLRDFDFVIKIKDLGSSGYRQMFSAAGSNFQCIVSYGGGIGFNISGISYYNWSVPPSTGWVFLRFLIKDNKVSIGQSTNGIDWSMNTPENITTPFNNFTNNASLCPASAALSSASVDLNNTYIKVNDVYWFRGQPAMTKTLSCVGATGTADLTADDKDIALNKGWSLTLS